MARTLVHGNQVPKSDDGSMIYCRPRSLSRMSCSCPPSGQERRRGANQRLGSHHLDKVLKDTGLLQAVKLEEQTVCTINR
jgi:hypothetical protein